MARTIVVTKQGIPGTPGAGGYAPGGTDVAVADGGTGASSATAARTNLGLGNVDNTSDVNKPISTLTQTALNGKEASGAYRPGGTDVAVADGGTGASTAAAALANLGLGGGLPGQVLKVGPGGVLYYEYPVGSYPETHFIEHNDLAYHTLAAASTIGQISLRTTGAGASAATIVSEPGHPGIVELFTGTTVTGVAQFLAKSNGLFVVGAGLMFIEGVVRIPVLSDATDSFNVTVGFSDSASPAADISRRVLTYRHDINGGKWQACCSNLAVVDTGVPVVAGTWYRLRVEVDPILDQCRYYIDGALRTTITTNQPVDAQLFSTYPASIEKAAGTTTRSLQVDFYKLGQIYTVPRW